jgi:type I restriction enzyme S subunit
MKSEWQQLPVSAICDIRIGGTPKRSDPKYWGGSIKWASAADIAKCSSRYIYTTAETITQKGLQESAAKLLDKDTIVITARGTVGELCMLSEPMTFNQTCYGLITKDEIVPSYLYYALKSTLSQIRSISYGTVFDTITIKSFDSLKIPIPSFREQKAIACILGALDDKIELNRRMNKTLEAMARAIFKSWFIDFDPVRIKAEGKRMKVEKMSAKNSIYPSSFTLSPSILDLFPDSFKDSELGKIPKGWKVGTLGEEFNLTMGQSPPGDSYNEIGEGIPFYQGRSDFGFRYPTRRVYCTSPTRFANPGDSLVSVRAPVGDINMAIEKCCIGRGVAAIRHNGGNRSYTYYSMHSISDLFLDFEAGGTVFGCINKNDFQGIKHIVPPQILVNEFEARIFPIDQVIENNTLQSRTLAAMRDALLTKLMSGKIRMAIKNK